MLVIVQNIRQRVQLNRAKNIDSVVESNQV